MRKSVIIDVNREIWDVEEIFAPGRQENKHGFLNFRFIKRVLKTLKDTVGLVMKLNSCLLLCQSAKVFSCFPKSMKEFLNFKFASGNFSPRKVLLHQNKKEYTFIRAWRNFPTVRNFSTVSSEILDFT